MRELLAGLTYGRRINDRHQLLQMIGQHPIEKGPVAIKQGHHGDVFTKRGTVAAHPFHHPLDLIVHGRDMSRQQAEQTEVLSLGAAESGALVEHRVL